MVEEFIVTLENFLGVQRTVISIQDRWQACPPTEAKGLSLKEYTKQVRRFVVIIHLRKAHSSQAAFWPMCRDYYDAFADYRNAYKAKYGANAYEGPVVNYRW